MSLFQTRRNALKVLLASEWDGRKQRDELLVELRASSPRAADLIPLLYTWDAAVREAAAELFLPQADQAMVTELIAGLGHRHAKARGGLVPILARIGESTLRPALEELFVEQSPANRLLAWEIALAMPDSSFHAAYVKRAAFEAPTALRLRAIEELSRDSGVRQYLAILLRLAREADPEVAPVVLKVLSQVSDPQILELMLDHLAEGTAESRAVAQQYLRREAKRDPEAMQHALLKLVTHGTDATRKVAVSILLDPDSGEAEQESVILQILQLVGQIPGWMRAQILDALRGGGEIVLRVAARLTQHQDEEIRTNAIMALAEGFDDPRLVAPFCRVLRDPDWWLRVTACGVLGALGDARAVPHLVHMLRDESTRWAAIDALALIGAPSALKPLSKLLSDPREEIRQEVLAAFSRFDDRRLLPIVEAVRDRDPSADVRGRAAEVLHEMSLRLGCEETAVKRAAQPQLRPLDQLLARIRQMGASDLHLNPGEPPVARVDGVLQALPETPALSPEQAASQVREVLSEEQETQLDSQGAFDFCHTVPGAGRFRANAYVERHGLCSSYRVIPDTPPTFADLRLPGRLRELLDYHQGVIVLSGPAGCGKSTTLSALVNLINETRSTHLITLEDPIEFIHPPKAALINQRQVGLHTRTFASGLRAALREDPDVIVVGELRDTESIRLALVAAETGHLVISTLHTTSAVQTIDRLAGSFPSDEQAQARMALSESLKYVICQHLIPKKQGSGRVAAFEVLKCTMSVGNMIRKNETFQIPGLMQIGYQIGMRTLDQALSELVEADLIAPELAWRLADKPESFKALCDPEAIDGLGQTVSADQTVSAEQPISAGQTV